ncbi:DHA2 family lincomycin resistance protein-like MFS transporter [Deinobacterium chartae]|uniref:DHA2 family lincomycin resistance protein-like MFS transporter n=1 Tax=Deinobacterium chartae TaxID=521158 RepID=A0A841HVD8_9DEIO|nr:MDR family MFS transporter [Deinobacterium chartae]MBB6096886.1 DHA2 family lincomycin resistance protein-like MFS transporter [Deinobacterium chartae]
MTSNHAPAQVSRSDMGIIAIMIIATFVVILNETIMNVALPRLIVDLNVTASTVQWLSTAFLLVMGILIPTTGFLIQRYSTRTLFIVAMGLFCLGTLIAGIAAGFPVLLLGRIVQAAGTAIMLPLLTTVVLALVPPERRGSVMGSLSIVISVAPAVGPTLSGLILQVLPWRFMFLFVLPIALLALFYGIARLRNVGETRTATLDIPSVLLSAVGFGGVVYGFSSAGEGGGHWDHPQVVVPLVAGVLSLIVFTLRQLRLKTPLLDLRAFRFPMFTLSTALMMVAMMALFASALLLPIYLQTVRHLEPLQVGLLLLPGGVLMGIASPIVGRLFDRYGPTVLAGSGAVLMTLILWQFTTLDASTPVARIVALQMTLNLGLALLFTPAMTTGLNQLPRQLYSHGSALSSTLQQVSGAVGTALLVTVMTTASQNYLRNSGNSASPAAQLEALTTGLHASFTVASGVALLAVVLALCLRRSQPQALEGDEVGEPAFSAH